MTVTRTKDDLTVGDLETTGGKLLPEQGPKRRRCPAGFKLNRRTGICEPKSSKTMKVLNDDWVESNERIQKSVRITKVDEDQRLVFGEVYAPNVPDTQGDFMTTEEIQKMAHNFMRARRQEKVDEQHNNEEAGHIIVESFIVRAGDPDFPIPGAWVAGAHIPSDDVWLKVVKGEINGFSMEAIVTKITRQVVIELDEEIVVQTAPGGENEHTHQATLNFDSDGNFLGGATNVVDAHWHPVEQNTVTGPEVNVNAEPSNGHRHRYSFMEFLHIVSDVGDTVTDRVVEQDVPG